MRRILIWAIVWAMTGGCACGQEVSPVDSLHVRMKLMPVSFNAGKPLEFTWQEGDSVAVWADSVALTYYKLADGAGKAEGIFDGPALLPGTEYHAEFTGKMPGDTLRVTVQAGENGGALFQLEHSAAFLRLRLTPAKGKAASGIGLLPTSLEPAFLSERLDSLTQSTTILKVMPPRKWTPADAWAAIVTYTDGTLGTARLQAQSLTAGQGLDYVVNPVTEVYQDVSSNIPFSAIAQQRQLVPSGEYSGITYMGEGRYAVVHDKSAGGGIHFFRIALDQDGYPLASSEGEAAGNASQSAGKDNEGVVYVPSSQTLYVSAEADQSILEYDLQGRPTGRALSIPADLKEIQPNAGFEALGYGGGLFWTVTEKNLPADDAGFLRLQAFDATTLEPSARYFYRCAQPVIAASLVQSASAYVFGVPAITVLPDGRLLVLEREVYVPGGSILDKAFNSMTRSSLYVVDPLHDPAGILQKRLLTRFQTSSLNLANFEGMCLGPALPDGRVPLILIADSQGGMDGLTAEYLKVFLLSL